MRQAGVSVPCSSACQPGNVPAAPAPPHPRHRRHAPRQHCARRQHARAHAVAADELGCWDVVEYAPPPPDVQPAQQPQLKPQQQQQLRLGLVQEVSRDALLLAPLVEEEEGIWVPEAEDAADAQQQQRVALERVLRVVDAAYGQRQDKEHNPHGEHAHDVWQVLSPLSPGLWRGPEAQPGGSSPASSAAGEQRGAA